MALCGQHAAAQNQQFNIAMIHDTVEKSFGKNSISI